MKYSSTRLERYLKGPCKVNKEIIPPCSEALPMHTLAGTPSELFLLISDFLLVIDVTCLSLCYRRFRELSLRRIIVQSPHPEDEKLLVLSRLERDSPEYFACDICDILHRYDGSGSFGLSGLPHQRTCRLPCVDEWFSDSCILHPHYNWTYQFSFLQLKLAMRRFYYGSRAGVSTDSLQKLAGVTLHLTFLEISTSYV
jgi:hypothetical protein